jgi:hypothetical protein
VIFPDFGGVAAAGELERVIGALLTFVLVVAVLMIVVSAAAWAIGRSSGSLRMADRGRMGLWVSVGAAAAAGAMTAWLNVLLDIGAGL